MTGISNINGLITLLSPNPKGLTLRNYLDFGRSYSSFQYFLEYFMEYFRCFSTLIAKLLMGFLYSARDGTQEFYGSQYIP